MQIKGTFIGLLAGKGPGRLSLWPVGLRDMGSVEGSEVSDVQDRLLSIRHVSSPGDRQFGDLS